MAQTGYLSLFLGALVTGCVTGAQPPTASVPNHSAAAVESPDPNREGASDQQAPATTNGGVQSDSTGAERKPSESSRPGARPRTPLPAPPPPPRTDGMEPALAAALSKLYERAIAEYRAGDFKACTSTYLEANRLAPRASDSDIWLHSAMICARQGRLLGTAIAIGRQLLRQYPRSRMFGPTLLSLADMQNEVGQLELAAGRYESFGARFPAARSAWTAWVTAIRLRIALGHHERARANIMQVHKMYGRKRLRQSAQLALAAIPGYRQRGDDDGLIAYLRSYLKGYRRAAPELRILALSELASALWRSSCPSSSIDVRRTAPTAACLKKPRRSARAARRRARCDQTGDRRTIWQVQTRNKRAADEAQALFRQVLDLAGRTTGATGTSSGQKTPNVREAIASAHYHLAAPALEASLRARFPRSLSGSSRGQKSLAKRLRNWGQAYERGHRILQQRHSDVLKVGSARWSVASAARLALLNRQFADVLASAAVPAEAGRGPRREALTLDFCTALDSRVQPLRDLAIRAYEHCLAVTRESRYHDAQVTVCRRSLAEMRPDKYSATRELFAAPTRLSTLGLTAGKDVAHWRSQAQTRPRDPRSHLGLAAALLVEYRALMNPDAATSAPVGEVADSREQALSKRIRATLSVALIISPEDVRALVLLAYLHVYGGNPADLAQARMFLDRAVRADERFGPAWNALGVLAIREREWARAAPLFERARTLAGASGDSEALINSGLYSLATGAYQDAHRYLKAALGKSPDDYDATVGAAVALRRLGRLDAARAAYERALGLHPTRIEAPVGLALLEMDFVAKKSRDPAVRKRAFERARTLLSQARQRPGVTVEDRPLIEALFRQAEQYLAR